jgi:signal transduction histidine kinase
MATRGGTEARIRLPTAAEGGLLDDVRRQLGLAAPLAILATAVASVLLALATSLSPDSLLFDPTDRWAWWPGPPGVPLILFVTGVLVLGLAAFLRRPRSGVSQALLAGTSGNAGNIALWSMIDPSELAAVSTAWLAFVVAGMLSLVLWSSLVHLVLVFSGRDPHVVARPWIIPLIYVLPQAALLLGALASGAFTPISLEWVDSWGPLHAAIVSVLLVGALAGIGGRFVSVSAARRRQVAGVAASVALTVLASLVLIDLPITLRGEPIVEREVIVLLALPIPFFLALALWQDRNFRLDRLRRSQMALLLAREEERRRLRRDLHDGLGPTLAAVGLKVDAAAAWLESDPARAREVLDEVRLDLTSAASETRRLVRGLRPPGLAEHGLGEAVRRLAGELSPAEGNGPRIEVSAADLPTLPAAVEVAAYRIVHEGLTNVVRHAHAQHCEVRLEATNGDLRIAVADDGIGLKDVEHTGVGTESMRERAEEIGGECWIISGAGKGTQLNATLPLTPG